MGRSIFQQETQVRRSLVADILDNVAPSEANFETNPVSLLDDLNNIRSQLHNLLKNQAGNWWDDLNIPATLETGAQRGVNDLNTALHAIEKKRILRNVHSLVDVTVSASQNWEILGTGELPSNTTAAVGAVTTLGTVVAPHGATFGTHALSEVAGATAIDPLNLLLIVDGATRDPILSGGRVIYGLLQGESGVTDGATITDATATRVQISFVRINATGDDLEAVPVADIENKIINYSYRERVRLESLNEYDFLSGAIVDVPAGSTVTRQVGYDNQGTTPVDLTTNATLDLEGAGLVWSIRDDLEAELFAIVEGSAGGTSVVRVAADVDTFDVNAAVNDFLNGASFDTGAAGTTINVGVTANQIDSGGALTIVSTSADLRLVAGSELVFDDSYRSGSTWSLNGIRLADTSQEWSDFETAFGEVSLMNAIYQAWSQTGRTRVWSVATADVAADTDTGGPTSSANFDTDFGALDGGTFVDDYDFYLNGQYLRPGANAAANHDLYPGTSLAGAGAQLKFEFKIKTGDQLAIVKYV